MGHDLTENVVIKVSFWSAEFHAISRNIPCKWYVNDANEIPAKYFSERRDIYEVTLRFAQMAGPFKKIVCGMDKSSD